MITAVLTHHLGWVATVLDPNANDKETIKKLQRTGNPLWGQLNDLYGAVGSPTKMAHTIITGSNKPELIAKLLNSLTYFIRCNDVLKQSASRWDVVEENCTVDRICREKHCIPKENYKKYQDHLDEMAVGNSNTKKFDIAKEISLNLKLDDSKINDIMRYSELKKLDEIKDDISAATNEMNIRPLKGLTKTSTCLGNLNKMEEDDLNGNSTSNSTLTRTNTALTKAATCLSDLSKMAEVEKENTNEDNISNNTLCVLENSSSSTPRDHFGLTNEDINRKVQMLFRGPKDVSKYHSNQDIHKFNKVDLEKQRSSSSSILSAEQNKNVVFVLGENEPLVGLKKTTSQNTNSESSRKVDNNLKRNSIENIPGKNFLLVDSSLDSSVEESVNFDNNADFKDSDFVKYGDNYSLKPSTSWTHLDQEKAKTNYEINQEATCSTSSEQSSKKKSFFRSQSEPPEHVQSKTDSSSKPRFRYTGVKFNFQQHPQIFTNYMRSKNIELSNLSFAEKTMKFNGDLSTNFDFSNCEDNFEEVEALQTPSNASELEFTSELGALKNVDLQCAKETTEKLQKTFKRSFLPNTIIRESTLEEICHDNQEETRRGTEKSNVTERNGNKLRSLKLVELPMPK